MSAPLGRSLAGQALGPDTGDFMAAAIVPAVLISACALLLLSFNNRIVAVLTRQRALHRELLEESRRAARASLSNAWPSFASNPDAPPAHGAAHHPSCLSKVAFAADQIAAGCDDAASSVGGGGGSCAGGGGAPSEWGAALAQQVEELRREAWLIRSAVTAILAAILLFLASGVTLASSTLAPRAGLPALVVFLAGLAAFATGVALMLAESLLIVHPLVVEEAHVRRVVSCSAARSCMAAGAAASQSQAALRVVIA